MWGCSNLGSIFCHPLPVCCLPLRGRRFFLPAVSFTSVFRPVILSACPCLRSHLRCVRACVWHRRRATTASHRNTRESASFLRLLSTVRFSFVRSPTATTIRASSRGWTTTRASCCAAPTPSARGAGSTSRPTPGRATSSSKRSSPGGGSAPTTRGTTPRPSSRVSGIRIRWHREREAGRRKWRKGVKCRHCKQMRSCVSSPVEC